MKAAAVSIFLFFVFLSGLNAQQQAIKGQSPDYRFVIPDIPSPAGKHPSGPGGERVASLQIGDYFINTESGSYQPGHKFDLTVQLNNTSGFLVEEITVEAEFPDGVYASETSGRQALASIPANESRELAFGFFVSASYSESTVPIRLKAYQGERPLAEQEVVLNFRTENKDAATFEINRQGMDRALLFASDRYENMTPLFKPIRDAKALAEELRTNFGFETEVVENPSLEDIYNKLQEYKGQYSKGIYDSQGQLLLFFSGHGAIEDNNGYFLVGESEPDNLLTTAIPYNTYRNVIDNINCKHILVAIDACFSGSFDEKTMRSPPDFGRIGENDLRKIYASHLERTTRLFFSSSALEETPDRSQFAHWLLEGLRTGANEWGYLSARELHVRFLARATPQPLFNYFGDNNDPGSTFLFFKKTR